MHYIYIYIFVILSVQLYQTQTFLGDYTDFPGIQITFFKNQLL